MRQLGTGRAPLPPLTERTRSPTCRVPARWAAPPSAMREMKIPCRREGRRALYCRLAWPCPPAPLPGPAHPPHRVSSPVGCGAFPPSDAEPQPLLAAHEAGHVALAEGPGGLRLEQGQAQAASPPLPGAVVVLRPQRRDGDRVLGLHHTLPPQPHVHRGARPTQRLHGLLVLGVLQGHAVHLQATALVRAGPSTGGQAEQGTGHKASGGPSLPLLVGTGYLRAHHLCKPRARAPAGREEQAEAPPAGPHLASQIWKPLPRSRLSDPTAKRARGFWASGPLPPP